MKPFTDYLMEINRKYEFVVRIANCDIKEQATEMIKSSLSMYVVESISALKRLPIQEHRDFAGIGACEVHMCEVTLKYPTITPQIRQLVAEKFHISPKQVVVRTKLEESQVDYHTQPVRAQDGSVLNNPELESDSSQHLVGDQRVDSMLKELQSKRFEFAAKETTSKPVDMPINTTSPVGSKQNTIPNPAKGK